MKPVNTRKRKSIPCRIGDRHHQTATTTTPATTPINECATKVDETTIDLTGDDDDTNVAGTSASHAAVNVAGTSASHAAAAAAAAIGVGADQLLREVIAFLDSSHAKATTEFDKEVLDATCKYVRNKIKGSRKKADEIVRDENIDHTASDIFDCHRTAFTLAKEAHKGTHSTPSVTPKKYTDKEIRTILINNKVPKNRCTQGLIDKVRELQKEHARVLEEEKPRSVSFHESLYALGLEMGSSDGEDDDDLEMGGGASRRSRRRSSRHSRSRSSRNRSRSSRRR